MFPRPCSAHVLADSDAPWQSEPRPWIVIVKWIDHFTSQSIPESPVQFSSQDGLAQRKGPAGLAADPGEAVPAAGYAYVV